eukprot:2873214-Amphidinium_carterae.1
MGLAYRRDGSRVSMGAQLTCVSVRDLERVQQKTALVSSCLLQKFWGRVCTTRPRPTPPRPPKKPSQYKQTEPNRTSACQGWRCKQIESARTHIAKPLEIAADRVIFCGVRVWFRPGSHNLRSGIQTHPQSMGQSISSLQVHCIDLENDLEYRLVTLCVLALVL